MDLKCSTTINTDEIVYTWDIKNYSINGKKNGEVFMSPIFSNAPNQTLWSLWLYPKGDTNNNYEYLSLKLCFKCSNQIFVETDYSFCVLDSTETEVGLVKRHYVFDKTTNYLDGFSTFIKQTDLYDKKLLINDKLTIRCKIKAGINITNVYSSNFSSEQTTNVQQLQQDFQKLALSEKFSDLTLMVDEVPFKVHKAILTARSLVFSKMFDNNMIEQNENVVKIQDIDYEVVAELIQFIYTGKVSKLDTLASALLMAADKYALYDLKDMCEKFLCRNLTIDTAADLLCLADHYGAKELKTKVIDFIKKNTKEVLDTVGYKELELTNPALIAEVFRIISLK